ncbi:rabenosyn-5 [Erinaceus europaeus]|uniref:Rabenosyn-5 n=1 Tax=Erinaceus europaeus TaxID=9365 RepID=A0ABM3WJA0_ERIEU|nr:rabenosyn-5 [Erinaceus europaeus]
MASLDDPGEVREGFLCPLCLKDLQSFYQLQSHYEEEHSGEDRDVRGQIRSLVQKAKKAKNRLLKREGEDRVESGPGYESFSYGGVDPSMWEPQELGAVRSHLSDFKKHRAARIDHYVVEVNKLIIRLEKLTAFDRTNVESAKIRAIEKSVVPWVSDQDVPFCPDCGSKFSIRNRRHHCRLCGSIMCGKCVEFLSLPLANKLTSASKNPLSAHSSPSHSPGSVQGSRRSSISSVSSISSGLDEKDDAHIRCCAHCRDTLLKREQQLDEREHTPDIVKLYEKLRLCMEKVDQKAPEYIRMAASLNAGETTYSLEHANDLRVEVQKDYELIDALSKKILTLGLNQEPPPHPSSLRLQKMVRYSATLFVQEKLLGLMSLPTKEQFEELKKRQEQEMERKRVQERQAALEAQQRRDPASRGAAEGVAPPPPPQKAEGWLPLTEGRAPDEDSDPLLQQIHNITSFLRQARAAGRMEEASTLRENLQQLQAEWEQQQVAAALALSLRQAEAEALQRQQLQVLCQQTWARERAQLQATSLHPQACSPDSRRARPFRLEPGPEPCIRPASAPCAPSPDAMPEPPRPWEPCPPSSMLWLDGVPSLNPFEEEGPLSLVADGRASPLAHGPKEYNPFEGEDEDMGPGNPFASPDSPAPNPFDENDEGNECPVLAPPLPPVPSNPFEDGDSGPEAEAPIAEELLLQQLDNVRAYIFDAKQHGRLDEVDVLTENLRELRRTLARQKGGTG